MIPPVPVLPNATTCRSGERTGPSCAQSLSSSRRPMRRPVAGSISCSVASPSYVPVDWPSSNVRGCNGAAAAGTTSPMSDTARIARAQRTG
jgi:hypothetical protein